MTHRTITVLTLIVLCVVCRLHAESEEKLPEITLDRILSKAEQVEMGLHKLTPQERDKLRIYIIDMFLKGIEEGKKQIASAQLPNVIESQIDGNFEGWEGETVVKLMNGQIWQQSEYYYHYHYAFMPKVLIYKSSGVYKMKVEGIKKTVRVIQLK